MQTVALIAAKVLTAGKAVATAAATAGKAVSTAVGIGKTAATAAGTASKASTVLKALRIGTSAVSALSSFAQSRAEAMALDREAADADMQARQEFIQAQEQAAEIQRRANRTINDQLAVAAASGVDLGSGSVLDAQGQVQTEADRQLTISRNGAAMNAALRRSRAAALRGQAALTREGGLLKAGASLGQGYLDTRKVG